ncbi:mucin-2-like [Planococcus citri]|uniref:mucin-2-like n=1 Tax=Planococcus citri TaxID=170843 RepID=UPI0031F7B8AE
MQSSVSSTNSTAQLATPLPQNPAEHSLMSAPYSSHNPAKHSLMSAPYLHQNPAEYSPISTPYLLQNPANCLTTVAPTLDQPPVHQFTADQSPASSPTASSLLAASFIADQSLAPPPASSPRSVASLTALLPQLPAKCSDTFAPLPIPFPATQLAAPLLQLPVQHSNTFTILTPAATSASNTASSCDSGLTNSPQATLAAAAAITMPSANALLSSSTNTTPVYASSPRVIPSNQIETSSALPSAPLSPLSVPVPVLPVSAQDARLVAALTTPVLALFASVPASARNAPITARTAPVSALHTPVPVAAGPAPATSALAAEFAAHPAQLRIVSATPARSYAQVVRSNLSLVLVSTQDKPVLALSTPVLALSAPVPVAAHDAPNPARTASVLAVHAPVSVPLTLTQTHPSADTNPALSTATFAFSNTASSIISAPVAMPAVSASTVALMANLAPNSIISMSLECSHALQKQITGPKSSSESVAVSTLHSATQMVVSSTSALSFTPSVHSASLIHAPTRAQLEADPAAPGSPPPPHPSTQLASHSSLVKMEVAFDAPRISLTSASTSTLLSAPSTSLSAFLLNSSMNRSSNRSQFATHVPLKFLAAVPAAPISSARNRSTSLAVFCNSDGCFLNLRALIYTIGALSFAHTRTYSSSVGGGSSGAWFPSSAAFQHTANLSYQCKHKYTAVGTIHVTLSISIEFINESQQ